MTDLLIFGRTGQVATELHRRQPDATYLARADVDLTDTAAIATAINSTAPGVMAGEAATLGVPFLHVSTDYVFEGGGEAFWRVEDPIAPLGAYGRSKAAGEALVASHGGAHAILRTSWVFSAHGNNFVKTMLRLAETRDALTVVEDQIGGPTAAADIADALLSMADQMPTNIVFNAERIESLTVEIGFNDHALERNAVAAVFSLGHGSSLSESQAWGKSAGPVVQPQGRTPRFGEITTATHRVGSQTPAGVGVGGFEVKTTRVNSRLSHSCCFAA